VGRRAALNRAGLPPPARAAQEPAPPFPPSVRHIGDLPAVVQSTLMPPKVAASAVVGTQTVLDAGQAKFRLRGIRLHLMNIGSPAPVPDACTRDRPAHRQK